MNSKLKDYQKHSPKEFNKKYQWLCVIYRNLYISRESYFSKGWRPHLATNIWSYCNKKYWKECVTKISNKLFILLKVYLLGESTYLTPTYCHVKQGKRHDAMEIIQKRNKILCWIKFKHLVVLYTVVKSGSPLLYKFHQKAAEPFLGQQVTPALGNTVAPPASTSDSCRFSKQVSQFRFTEP